MIKREKITGLVEKIVQETEFFIVDVTVTAKNKISVLIDKNDGITIYECAEINRKLKNQLDRKVEDFELEVSSPGLNASFKVKQQYRKNIGREILVVTNNDKIHKGKLLKVEKTGIMLETIKNNKAKRRKENQVTELTVGFNQIKSAKIVLSYK
jgi:ribosome maturation factor RimP